MSNNGSQQFEFHPLELSQLDAVLALEQEALDNLERPDLCDVIRSTCGTSAFNPHTCVSVHGLGVNWSVLPFCMSRQRAMLRISLLSWCR